MLECMYYNDRELDYVFDYNIMSYLPSRNPYHLYEKYNFPSTLEPKPKPQKTMEDEDQDYYHNMCLYDKWRLANAFDSLEFDYQPWHTEVHRRFRETGPRIHRFTEDYKPCPEILYDEFGRRKSLQEVDQQRQEYREFCKAMQPPNEECLKRREIDIPNTNVDIMSHIDVYRIACYFIAYINWYRATEVAWPLVMRELYLDMPYTSGYYPCTGHAIRFDYLWELPYFVFFCPFCWCLLYMDCKQRSFICYGFSLITWGVLGWQGWRNTGVLFWILQDHENTYAIFWHEWIPNIILGMLVGWVLLHFFYSQHECLMLARRGLRCSTLRQINREIDAKYLNRLKTRRKVVRQIGRADKGKLVKLLMHSSKRTVRTPHRHDLVNEFKEGVNRYRVLCGAEYIRLLNIPQRFTYQNHNLMEYPEEAPPVPNPPHDRRYSWSDMWRPKYRYQAPPHPPILDPDHDLRNHIMAVPPFEKFRVKCWLLYQSEDWLADKRSHLKLAWSTKSFAWERHPFKCNCWWPHEQ